MRNILQINGTLRTDVYNAASEKESKPDTIENSQWPMQLKQKNI